MPESLPTDQPGPSDYGQTYEAQQSDVNRENGYPGKLWLISWKLQNFWIGDSARWNDVSADIST
jgi:hypothetical protein